MNSTRSDQQRAGKEARKRVPRGSHAHWEPFPGRPDPVELLEEQATTRLPDLVPIRYGRMVDSPFAFFRGAALLMASDLARTPDSGLTVQACGDAHLSNFGGFASPERELIFDINDFDETSRGPWEWDVKRLAASVAIAGRARDLSAAERRTLVLGAVGRYRAAMRRFAGMGNLRFGIRCSTLSCSRAPWPACAGRDRKELRADVRKAAAKATTKDSMRAFAKLTTLVDGQLQIISDPPVIVRAADLLPPGEALELQEAMNELQNRYRASLADDRCRLLEGYRFVDMARKVVGVGSVGTRCWILLLRGAVPAGIRCSCSSRKLRPPSSSALPARASLTTTDVGWSKGNA